MQLPGFAIRSSPLFSGMFDPKTRALLDELPYLYCGEYEEFAPLHLLADGTLGYAFSLGVPTVDTVPDGESLVSSAILAMLHAVPPDVQWQWFLTADSCVEEELAKYETQEGTDRAGRLFAENFVQRWRLAQQAGFFPEIPELNFYPRSQRILVALKSSPLGLANPGWKELVRGLRQAREKDSVMPVEEVTVKGEGARARAREFVGAVRDVLASASANGLSPLAVDADGLLSWVERLLFPQRRLRRGQRHSHADPHPAFAHNETRSAAAALGRIEGVRPDGFSSIALGEACHHRVVSVLLQPRAVAPGMINQVLALRPRLTVAVSATPLAPASALLQLKARALLNARSTHRFNATEMGARAEALHEVEQRIFAEGERIFEARIHFHIAEQSDADADRAAALVCRYLETLEIEAAVEVDVGSALLLRGGIPFAVYPETERKLRRRRRYLSRDCAELHPGGGCWTGVPPTPRDNAQLRASPVVMYSNPHGEPLFIDPTKAEKNPHALIVGQSGSGKSFFVHDYLLHLWRLPDVRLFLISIKSDYRKLALLLGRYVEVSLDADISLNPFAGRPTLENQARWFAALALMLSDGEDALKQLPRDAEVALQSAALAAAQRNWDSVRDAAMRETTLEDVCLELERSAGHIGRGLALQLHPYRRGPYRRLFNAPRGVSAADRFVFFNLGHILSQPCSALASFCVFGIIDEVMADTRLRGVPKGLVADEVWALVKNPYAAAILERSLKAYRSLGGFAVPIVQDPQDLDTPSGRVMLVNTATKVILPLDRSGQSDLQRYVRLNEREFEVVRNLRLFKRRYSEFFVSIDGMKSAKGLLIPDPLRYAIATTDPADEELIDRIFSECGSMRTAVEQFARDWPYGLRARIDSVEGKRRVPSGDAEAKE